MNEIDKKMVQNKKYQDRFGGVNHGTTADNNAPHNTNDPHGDLPDEFVSYHDDDNNGNYNMNPITPLAGTPRRNSSIAKRNAAKVNMFDAALPETTNGHENQEIEMENVKDKNIAAEPKDGELQVQTNNEVMNGEGDPISLVVSSNGNENANGTEVNGASPAGPAPAAFNNAKMSDKEMEMQAIQSQIGALQSQLQAMHEAEDAQANLDAMSEAAFHDQDEKDEVLLDGNDVTPGGDAHARPTPGGPANAPRPLPLPLPLPGKFGIGKSSGDDGEVVDLGRTSTARSEDGNNNGSNRNSLNAPQTMLTIRSASGSADPEANANAYHANVASGSHSHWSAGSKQNRM